MRLHAFAEVFAIEQLGLRFGRQIGDVEHIAPNQHVDQILQHPHQAGVQAGKLLLIGTAAQEGGHIRMVGCD